MNFNRIHLREWSFQEKLAIQDQEALGINNFEESKSRNLLFSLFADVWSDLKSLWSYE